MKLLAPALVLLLCVGLTVGHEYQQVRAERIQHQQINQAAEQQDLQTLTELSAASDSQLQRAYVQYRLALTAETRRDYPRMLSALKDAETALARVENSRYGADIHALRAAIHLRRMLHSEHPGTDRERLDAALAQAYQQDPENPGMLLVAAMSARHMGNSSEQEDALYDLMLHEAGVQFSRRCSTACASSEQSYIWQGVARSLDRETGSTGPWLIARASCLDDATQSLRTTGS